MKGSRILCSLVGLYLVVASHARADAADLLHVTAVSVGEIGDVLKPGSGSATGSYVFFLVSVTDEKGGPVAGLRPGNFSAFGTFIGEIQQAGQAREVSLRPLKVEAAFGAVSGANCPGCYLVQASTVPPVVLSSAAGHPARVVLRVTRTKIVPPTKSGGSPSMEVVATGQIAF